MKFNVGTKYKKKGITSRLEEICKQRVDLGLQIIAGETSTTTWQRAPSTCLPSEAAIYGRDKDKAKILKMVSRDQSTDFNFGVIAIIGMGALVKQLLPDLCSMTRKWKISLMS